MSHTGPSKPKKRDGRSAWEKMDDDYAIGTGILAGLLLAFLIIAFVVFLGSG